MSHITISAYLKQRGRGFVSCSVDRPKCGFANGHHVHSVDKFQRQEIIVADLPSIECHHDVRMHQLGSGSLAPPWQQFSANKDLEFVEGQDMQLLPLGVGAQLINDQRSNSTPGNKYFDRYLRTGAILFDSDGKFKSAPFDVRGNSDLGLTIGLPNSPTVTLFGTQIVYSQFGIALYDLLHPSRRVLGVPPSLEEPSIFWVSGEVSTQSSDETLSEQDIPILITLASNDSDLMILGVDGGRLAKRRLLNDTDSSSHSTPSSATK